MERLELRIPRTCTALVAAGSLALASCGNEPEKVSSPEPQTVIEKNTSEPNDNQTPLPPIYYDQSPRTITTEDGFTLTVTP